MLKETVELKKAAAFYQYLIEYLLCSTDIKTELEKLDKDVFSIGFTDILNMLIDIDHEYSYFDSFMQNNMNILLDHLASIDENNIVFKQKYDSYPKTNGGRFYADQIFLKYNNFDGFIKNNCISWNADDLRDSVVFDSAAYSSLLGNNIEAFLNEQYQVFICNQKFLDFVRKTIYLFPEVFKDKGIRAKTLAVLTYNSLLDTISDDKEFANKFMLKNEGKQSGNTREYRTKYNYFMKDNNELLENIRMNNFYKHSYSILEYIIIYNHNKVLDLIYNKKEVPQNPLLLDYMVRHIMHLSDAEFTSENKKTFIDMLANIRPCIGKDQLGVYNKCIGYINLKSNAPVSILNSYNLDIDKLGPVAKRYVKLLRNLCNKNDICGKNVYAAHNDFFDYLNGNVDRGSYSPEEAALAIKSCLKTYPTIFLDKTIRQRLDGVLSHLPINEQIKINNKIEKVYRKEKM